METFYTLDVTDEDFSQTLRLCTLWDNAGRHDVFILLVVNNKSFRVSVTEEELQKWAIDTSTDFQEYLECMKIAFTSIWGPKNDLFSFKECVLSWQRVFKDFVVVFGSHRLKPLDSGEFIGIVISALLDRCYKLEKNVTYLSNENDGLQRRLNELQDYAEKIVSQKNEMESTLYSKFTILLNEKKKMIAQLNSGMDADE